MPFVYNPLTSELDVVNPSGGGGGGGAYTPSDPSKWSPQPTTTDAALDQLANRVYGNTFVPEEFTLQAADITNKYVVISATPISASKTRFSIISGGEQAYGVDFTVSGNQVGWNGLALDGVLSVGDKIIITHN